MSFDDLYNNFKIVEQEVKGTTSSNSSSSSQNMAFVSSPSSTNEVNIAYGVSTANTQVSPIALKLALLVLNSIAEHEAQKVFYKTGRKDQFQLEVATGLVMTKPRWSVSMPQRWHFTGNAEGLGNNDSL
ncbi:hypothetical protein Tco_1015652 [Tanacetum coccineum]|uniref:Uncharacterized protein n=1 Tax=Tanacetum coccineum TaxID=301880 RepID=A0ABQ5FLH2_9ASTR